MLSLLTWELQFCRYIIPWFNHSRSPACVIRLFHSSTRLTSVSATCQFGFSASVTLISPSFHSAFPLVGSMRCSILGHKTVTILSLNLFHCLTPDRRFGPKTKNITLFLSWRLSFEWDGWKITAYRMSMMLVIDQKREFFWSVCSKKTSRSLGFINSRLYFSAACWADFFSLLSPHQRPTSPSYSILITALERAI